MLAEVLILETNPDGDCFSVVIALQGQPRAIAQEIAAQSGDLHALCIEGKLANYTILTTFITKKGNVIVR